MKKAASIQHITPFRGKGSLHNNASELGARVVATWAFTAAVFEERAMDIFTTLVQTCRKLGASAYDDFRLHLRRSACIQSAASA